MWTIARNILLMAMFSGMVTLCAAEQPQGPADAQPPEQNKSENRDPFAPSDRMRDIEASPQPLDDSGSNAQSSSDQRLALESLIVKGDSALACFSRGTSWVLAEPGNEFTLGGLKYVFVKYDGETVVLQNGDGKTFEIRLGSQK